MTEILHIESIGEPAQIKLTRNAKGEYQWEINIHAENMSKALEIVHNAEITLRERYVRVT